MSLANARRRIREVREPDNILYRPQFTGKSWESDALERVRKQLLECLAWIELSKLPYDRWFLNVLRKRLSSKNYRAEIAMMSFKGHNEVVPDHQEDFRNELMHRFILVSRFVYDITR